MVAAFRQLRQTQLSSAGRPPTARRRRIADNFGRGRSLRGRPADGGSAKRHLQGGRTASHPVAAGSAGRHLGQSHSAVHRRPTASPFAADHGRRHIGALHARTPAERVAKTVAEFVVHPAVDDRVVTAVAHRQPVTGDPHRLNVAKPVNSDGQVLTRKLLTNV